MRCFQKLASHSKNPPFSVLQNTYKSRLSAITFLRPFKRLKRLPVHYKKTTGGIQHKTFHAMKCTAPVGAVLVGSALSWLKNFNTFVTLLASQWQSLAGFVWWKRGHVCVRWLYSPLDFSHLLFFQTNFICPVIHFVAAKTEPSIFIYR